MDTYPQLQHNVFNGLTLVTAASTPVLSAAEAKAHAVVHSSVTSDDTYIGTLVGAATRHVERYIGRSLITQTWELALNGFPPGDCLYLPRGPVQSVTSLKTYSDSDAESVFADTNYLVDTAGDRLCLNDGATWPTDLRDNDAIKVRYTAGYGDASTDVPSDLIHAVALLVAHWYENREAVITGTIASQLPLGVSAILAPYRRVRL
jgi:uncharacterized phiE125 gp8 family phage protein